MSDSFYVIDPELNELQRTALEVAEDYAENKSRSYSGTGVGAGLTTFDGEVFGGANMGKVISETDHAEQQAINNALTASETYNYTDFRDLVIYFDAGGRKSAICNSCQATAIEHTHPELNIFQADSDGAFYQTKLGELAVKVPGMEESEMVIWPQADYIGDHTNSEPALPLDEELHDAYKMKSRSLEGSVIIWV